MPKKLLFIEDQVLHHDQAAGARASYMYLKLLLDLGLSVTFVGADFRAPEPYTGHLRSLGVKVMAGPWFGRLWKVWFLLFARNFDYVFCNRPHPTRKFIDFIERFSRARVLYQCHDLHYLRLQRQFAIDHREKTRREAHNIERLELELINRSDVFLTFSSDEQAEIEQRLPGQRTAVIPLFFYDTLNPPITDFKDRHGILYVGGFKHQPNTDAVLWFLREVFPPIRRSCPELVFHVVGQDTPPEIAELAGDGVELHGFVSDEQLDELYNRVRLVVVPLRFGAGVKGKTVEAVHHSLPLVATRIGLEGIGLEKIIPATDEAEDFAERVITLYDDETALQQCSARLHDYARDHLTTSAAKDKMRGILDALS